MSFLGQSRPFCSLVRSENPFLTEVMILSMIFVGIQVHIFAPGGCTRGIQHEGHHGMPLRPQCATPNAIIPYTPAIQASLRPPGSSGCLGPFQENSNPR